MAECRQYHLEHAGEERLCSSNQQLCRKAHAGGRAWQILCDSAGMSPFCLSKTCKALLVWSLSTSDHVVHIRLLEASRPNQPCQTGLKTLVHVAAAQPQVHKDSSLASCSTSKNASCNSTAATLAGGQLTVTAYRCHYRHAKSRHRPPCSWQGTVCQVPCAADAAAHAITIVCRPTCIVHVDLMHTLWLTGKMAQCKRLDMQLQRRMLVRHVALGGSHCARTLQRMWSCT